MNRRDLVLATLASAEGRPFTPVQIQKAIFLLTRNVPGLIDQGPGFDFVPYDYGPFDQSVYIEADFLRYEGLAVVSPAENGRWSTYAASDIGTARGKGLLERLPTNISDYIRTIAEWTRARSFRDLVKSIYEAYPEMKANSIFRG